MQCRVGRLLYLHYKVGEGFLNVCGSEVGALYTIEVP